MTAEPKSAQRSSDVSAIGRRGRWLRVGGYQRPLSGFVVVLSCLVLLGACGTEAPVAQTTEGGPPEASSGDPLEPAAPPEEGPPGVVNYTRVDATVGCAGATPPEAMAQLKELGFVSVINFRTAEENGATVEEGKAAAEAAGLEYFHMPFRTPSAEVAEQFLETVADASNQPVFIHCGSANRVGAMWLIKRVIQDGWEIDAAEAEAEEIGLRSEGLKEFALSYVQAAAG